MFPSLDTKDYLEIGRMCMKDEMPRNSESQMLSQLVKWMKKNLPEIKVLFTWADGMVGKLDTCIRHLILFMQDIPVEKCI